MTPPINRLKQKDGLQRAQVDTVRLKKDIAKDHASHTADSKVVSSGKAGPQETKYRQERAQSTLNREVARRDSLNIMRKKK